ncbi:MAG: lipopolysaccharide assembly protein LapA domain-containing protein [Pseudomonadales bacterium]
MAWIKTQLFRLLLLILFGVLFLLATENSTSVSLQFLSLRSPELPLSWWLVGVFILGLSLGGFSAKVKQWIHGSRSS